MSLLRVVKSIRLVSCANQQRINLVTGDLKEKSFFIQHLGSINFDYFASNGYFLETKMLSEEQNNDIGLAHNDITPVVDTITINGENATIIKPKTKTVKVK